MQRKNINERLTDKLSRAGIMIKL